MPWQIRLAALGLTALAACTQFPDLDAAISPGAAGAAYPDLVPVEGLSARMPAQAASIEDAAAMAGRIAALRARAARLRGSVLDSPTRARMESGVPPVPQSDG